jgi:peptide/nickel transport system substrate-binding protein
MSNSASVLKHPVSRRRFLRVAGATGAVSILIACQPQSSGGNTQSSTPSNQDAVINYAMSDEPTSLDPGASGSAQARQIWAAMFDSLTRLGPDLTPAPNLATSWTTSADGLIWTFRLRSGVLFHDGEPVDASAVKFTYERLLDPKSNLAAIRFVSSVISEVRAPSPDTVEIVLKQPFAPLLSLTAIQETGIVSPKAVQRLAAGFAKQPVGSGAYTFKEWVPGQHVVVERNDRYWGDKAKNKQVVFMPVTQDTTRVALVESGQADLAQYIPPRDAKRLANDSKTNVIQTEALEVRVLKFNMLDDRLKDVNVRQALNYAINRDDIIATLLEGAGVPAVGPFPVGLAGALRTPKYTYNPTMAKQLLSAAGQGTGLKLQIAYTPGSTGSAQNEIMQAIQAQLRAVDVDASLLSLDSAAFASYRALPATSAAGQAKGLISHGQTLPYPDMSLTRQVYHSAFWPPAGSNYGFYKNARSDDLWDQGDHELDPAKRNAAYQELQTILVEDPPVIYLYQQRWLYLGGKSLKNVVLPTTEIIDFAKVEKS